MLRRWFATGTRLAAVAHGFSRMGFFVIAFILGSIDPRLANTLVSVVFAVLVVQLLETGGHGIL